MIEYIVFLLMKYMILFKDENWFCSFLGMLGSRIIEIKK